MCSRADVHGAIKTAPPTGKRRNWGDLAELHGVPGQIPAPLGTMSFTVLVGYSTGPSPWPRRRIPLAAGQRTGNQHRGHGNRQCTSPDLGYRFVSDILRAARDADQSSEDDGSSEMQNHRRMKMSQWHHNGGAIVVLPMQVEAETSITSAWSAPLTHLFALADMMSCVTAGKDSTALLIVDGGQVTGLRHSGHFAA